MGSKQDALVYIEQENTAEAEFMSRSFVDKEIRNRAYINSLGAELVMKFLASVGITTDNIHNIHSMSKILEKYDIADILLPNIHIDVRVIFDEKKIFIPKSHYKLEITPDIYVILKPANRFEHVEILGYIEADKINLKISNSEYYFIEKDKLKSINDLKNYIKNFTGSTSRSITEEDMLRGRQLSVALADHNITTDEEKELLELLLSSDELRESVLEFDNFETLAYNAAKAIVNQTSEIVPETILFEHAVSENEQQEQHENQNEEIELSNSDEEDVVLDESFFDDIIEQPQTPDIETAESNGAVTIEDSVETISNENSKIEENLPVQDETEPENSKKESLEETETIENFTVSDPMETLELEEYPAIDGAAQEEVNLAVDPDLSENIPQESVPEENFAAEDINEDLNEETILEEESIKEMLTIDETLAEISEEEIILPTTESLIDENVRENNEFDEDGSPETQNIEQLPVLEIDEPELTPEIQDETSESAAQENDLTEGLAQTISNVVQSTLENSVRAVSADDAVTGAGEAAAETAATEEAIKLAGISGDMVSDIVNNNIEKQYKNLDKIDYQKTDIAPDVKEIPENIAAADDLHTAKMQATLESEEIPIDLNKLQQVENPQEYEQAAIEQETVDFTEMENIETESFAENTDEFVNLSSISGADSKNLPDLNIDEEFTGLDLPDLSSYTINDDGTSNIDNSGSDINLGSDDEEEHLTDFKMNDIDNIDEDYNSGSRSEYNNYGDKIIIGGSSVSEFDPEYGAVSGEVFNLDEPDYASNSQEQEPAGDLEQTAEQLPDGTQDDTAIQTVQPDEFLTDEVISDDIEQENPAGETAQDWIEDTNYDNLADIPQPVEPVHEELSQEDMIVEPDLDNQKVFAVTENSTVISDKNFTAGEIPIDINNIEMPQLQDNEALESLYNDNGNVAGDTFIQSPGRITSTTDQKGGFGIILKLAGMLAVLAIVCVIGFNAAKLFKTSADDTPQPITDDALPAAPQDSAADNNILNVNPENVVNMEQAANALVNPETLKKAESGQVKTQTSVSAPKKQTGSVYVEVNKLTWEVPDYISYNPQFKQYFQSVGKSLRLSLNSDLLLATDYAYSNELRLSVTYTKDGTFNSSRIIKSSGSTQIDNIVLQTVNQTLKVLKAPQSVGSDESTTAILKIYF